MSRRIPASYVALIRDAIRTGKAHADHYPDWAGHSRSYGSDDEAYRDKLAYWYVDWRLAWNHAYDKALRARFADATQAEVDAVERQADLNRMDPKTREVALLREEIKRLTSRVENLEKR